MSIFSNLLKKTINLPEVELKTLPIANVFFDQLLRDGSKELLKTLSSKDLLLIVKILNTELSVRTSYNLDDNKKAGIGANYDFFHTTIDNTNKSDKIS